MGTGTSQSTAKRERLERQLSRALCQAAIGLFATKMALGFAVEPTGEPSNGEAPYMYLGDCQRHLDGLRTELVSFAEAAERMMSAITAGEIQADDEALRSGAAGEFLRRLMNRRLLQDADAIDEITQEMEDSGLVGVLEAWSGIARRMELTAGELLDALTLIRDAQTGVDEDTFVMRPAGKQSVRQLELELTNGLLDLFLNFTAGRAVATEQYLAAHAGSGLPGSLADLKE